MPSRAKREVYYEGKWSKATIYDMDRLRPGNEVSGTAVIEAPATTFFVPPGRHVRVDEWSCCGFRRNPQAGKGD